MIDAGEYTSIMIGRESSHNTVGESSGIKFKQIRSSEINSSSSKLEVCVF